MGQAIATPIPVAGASDEDKLSRWLAAHFGGTVERLERQPRWRPGWWATVHTIGGEAIDLYIRGERIEDYPPWPLEHEVAAITVLEHHGIPVPHVYGVCPDPHAAVLQAVPGTTDFSAVQEEVQRVALLEHYAEVMAAMHAIDPAEFAGQSVTLPDDARTRELPCYDLCDSMYRKGRKVADPRVEFLRRWVERNIPQGRSKVSILAVDSGQFMHHEGRVSALFDFEYACLGDPMIDVAMVPLRAGFEGMGDCRPFFRRYAELTGETFDHATLAFHVVWWMLCNPLIIAADLAEPPPHAAYLDYVSWYAATLVVALEALADLKGFSLDGSQAFDAGQPSRWARIIDVMQMRLPSSAGAEAYEATQQRAFLEFLRRCDARSDIEAPYLAAASRLIGRPLADWREADREMEAFVLAAGPEHDDDLIRIFHQWAKAEAGLVTGIAAYLPDEPTLIQPFSQILN